MPVVDRVVPPLAWLVSIVLGLGQPACGVLLQTAWGWSEERTERARSSHTLRIDTDPPGGRVTRASPDGPVDLGPAPVEDTASFVREQAWTEPKNLGLYIGGGLTTASGIAVIAVGANKGGAVDESDTSAFGLVFLGTIMLLSGLCELAAGAIYGEFGAEARVDRVIPRTYAYTGRLGDRPEVTGRAVVPRSTELMLSFDGSAVAASAGAPRPYLGDVMEPVVAVMEVEDVNAYAWSTAGARALTRDLGEQLRIFIAQRGVRTIDRGVQERVGRAHGGASASAPRRGCYDDACQLELGKAVAATHILRSRMTRFGSRCVLDAELIDLKSEVAVRASSARGECEAEGFLAMSEALSRSLLP